MVVKSEEDIMETIWEGLPKHPDEEHVTFGVKEIEEMWLAGFVDDETYSLEDWVKVFEPHKTEKDTYVLRKEDFLEKDKYRFRGDVMVPFEPFLINEGKYTDEGLQELIDLSIAPSCSLSRSKLQEFFADFKERYRDKSDNLIVMDMKGKREIAELINDNPSPTRRRELIFDVMLNQHLAEIQAGTSEIFKATPEQAAQVQITTFSTLPTSRSEKAARELKSIEKRKVTGATAQGEEGEEGVEVKKVKKSRKGFRG